MHQESDYDKTNNSFPILMIPTNCFIPSLGFEPNSVRLVNLTISSADFDGIRSDYYSGQCIVKILDKSHEADLRRLRLQITDTKDFSRENSIANDEQYVSGNSMLMFSDSAGWSSANQSSSIINDYCKSLEAPVLAEANECTVMETFVSDNNCDNEEVIGYSSTEETDSKMQSQAYEQQIIQNNGIDLNNLDIYEETELQCTELLCDLPEEIVVDEGGSKNGQSSALKQLLTPNNVSTNAGNTIIFVTDNSQPGQTIHKIELQDPSLKCKGQNNISGVYFETDSDQPKRKKYLCGSCNQTFNDMSSFRRHIDKKEKYGSNFKFFCTLCGKTLKSQTKIEAHAKGHGNPNLECNICKNVYSSKFVLRNHYRQKHDFDNSCNCKYCNDTFSHPDQLFPHQYEEHLMLMCPKCDYVGSDQANLAAHSKIHDASSEAVESNGAATSSNDISDDSSDCYLADIKKKNQDHSVDTVQKANSDIAKIVSSKMFLCNRQSKGRKICIVCSKSFDRLGELKRHLIEHIIKSSLAKTPIKSKSTINIRCAVCHNVCFSSISKYKNHLRKHAKLTIYQCKVCDKSFSDSSNFCKHKKIHAANYLECDLCQRRFYSKKMIAKHMEHHIDTAPKPCLFCNKMFYFQSTLNKHVKSIHTKESTKSRCSFCESDFESLKAKWDHEWSKHQARKIVVDCLICGRQFRKFTELKRHSKVVHGLSDEEDSKEKKMRPKK